MGHPQDQPTPIVTDNSTADGFANDTTKIKHSKAMDMRFYWIKDRVRQGHFKVLWQKGQSNLADYFTKHHPPSHHIAMCPTYLYENNNTKESECEGVLIPHARLSQPREQAGEPADSRLTQSHSGSRLQSTQTVGTVVGRGSNSVASASLSTHSEQRSHSAPEFGQSDRIDRSARSSGTSAGGILRPRSWLTTYSA